MKFLQLVPNTPTIDFMGRAKLFLGLSAFLVVASIALVLVRGLNFGVDFRGGILLEVKTNAVPDLGALRAELSGLGLGDVGLQEFGDPTDVLITVQEQPGGEKAQLAAIDMIKKTMGDQVSEYRRTEVVGPKVGGELVRGGAIATFLAMFTVAIYVWFRFEWQFGIAALISLVHDVVTTVGLFALTHLQFDLAALAAVMTIAGYSINDTVVVFDRVREDLRRFKRMPLPELLNHAVNSTLSRTVMTGATTLLAVLALVFFGGEVIRGFAIAMVWGVVVGMYSSFAVAVPLLLYTGLRRRSSTEEAAEPQAAAKGRKT